MTKTLVSLPTNAHGVRHEVVEEDGVVYDVSTQDCEAIFAQNAEMAAQGDGYTQDRTFRRVATVPITVIQQIQNDTGINFHDEDCAKTVLKLLDSNEYYKLRTANFRLT